MVIRRSTSGEVTRLLGDLAGADETRREAAMARLAVIGARAVDRLLGALRSPAPDAAGTAFHLAILQTLERIGDARAVGPALSILESGPSHLQPAATGILRGHVQSRDAAVATRVLEALTGVLLDPRRPEGIRVLALEAVRDLPDSLVGPLIDQVRRDASPLLRRHAGGSRASRRPGRGERAGEANLEAMLDTLPADAARVDELVAASGGDAPLLVLHRLVVAIRAREAECARTEERDRWAVVRAAVHQALGSRGSRVALYDLRETVEQSKGPLPIGMLAALAAVGDASCLEPIANAYLRVDDAWHRERLMEALRAIVAREGLTRRHAVMKRLTARVPELFVR